MLLSLALAMSLTTSGCDVTLTDPDASYAEFNRDGDAGWTMEYFENGTIELTADGRGQLAPGHYIVVIDGDTAQSDSFTLECEYVYDETVTPVLPRATLPPTDTEAAPAAEHPVGWLIVAWILALPVLLGLMTLPRRPR